MIKQQLEGEEEQLVLDGDAASIKTGGELVKLDNLRNKLDVIALKTTPLTKSERKKLRQGAPKPAVTSIYRRVQRAVISWWPAVAIISAITLSNQVVPTQTYDLNHVVTTGFVDRNLHHNINMHSNDFNSTFEQSASFVGPAKEPIRAPLCTFCAMPK